MGVLYLLYESASGYGLFERVSSDEITLTAADITDLKKFSSIVKLKAFIPFTSAQNALENINAISEGESTKTLADFLELNLPKIKSGSADSKYSLGVAEPKLGNVISETQGIKCKSNDMVLELLRGIRLHFVRYIKALKPTDLKQAQLGLSHSYSRSKVKFNVHRVDNMIIQSSALLDQLDKDLNTFSMRVREWYSWHFPELIRIVNDNYQFAQCAKFIKNKATLTDQSLSGLEEITSDSAKAQQILDAAKMSMGQDISPIDLINIEQFATRVVQLTEYRRKLHQYLIDKMNVCAPNLAALIGEQVGARLISHAGSLTNLAKYPASTVQILGAEKALFRALKTKGNTPKYGLIFHSTFIGRAGAKNKGRISRYLANKCSLASRIDSFSDIPTAVYGAQLRGQVEERLEFYKTGTAPRKNITVMTEAGKLVEQQAGGGDGESANGADKKKKKKDKKKDSAPAAAAAVVAPVAAPAAMADIPSESKKSKKDKKRKAEADPEPVAAEPVVEESKKSKKDKKKSKSDA